MLNVYVTTSPLSNVTSGGMCVTFSTFDLSSDDDTRLGACDRMVLILLGSRGMGKGILLGSRGMGKGILMAVDGKVFLTSYSSSRHLPKGKLKREDMARECRSHWLLSEEDRRDAMLLRRSSATRVAKAPDIKQ